VRKRTLILLFLPIILIIWTIGWTFFWAGSQRQTTQKQPKKDNVHMTVQLPQQQEQEITE
jgi:flagellar basal body-associated protein FliL